MPQPPAAATKLKYKHVKKNSYGYFSERNAATSSVASEVSKKRRTTLKFLLKKLADVGASGSGADPLKGGGMKKVTIVMCVFSLILGFALYGCGGAPKAESSRQAIDATKTMQDTQEKVNYLIGQAKAFYNSKEFQDAVNTAQYILQHLDKDSSAAKNLLEKAKKALADKAKGAVDDAKKKIGF